MTWALAQKLRAPDKLALLLLAYRAAPDTDVADPAIDTLARECGMSRSGLKLVLQRLTDAGLVGVEERKTADGKNLPNLYRITFKADGGEGSRGDRGRGHDVTGGRGHDVTTRAGSYPDSVLSADARTKMEASWPELPDPKLLADWLQVRKRKRAPVTDTVLELMGAELHRCAEIGWSVDEALGECIVRGWQAIKATWLPPKPGKETPPPDRAGASGQTTLGRGNYAQGGRSGKGGAIDRVLAGIRADRSAREAAAEDGS
jgi:hypothetical protein